MTRFFPFPLWPRVSLLGIITQRRTSIPTPTHSVSTVLNHKICLSLSLSLDPWHPYFLSPMVAAIRSAAAKANEAMCALVEETAPGAELGEKMLAALQGILGRLEVYLLFSLPPSTALQQATRELFWLRMSG